MGPKCCPTCGQIVPPQLLFRSPTAGQPVLQRIYDYVSRHPEGVTTQQIEGAVYADDPDGGPGSGKAIAVHVWRMNRTLRNHGLVIRSPRGRSQSGYTLRQLSPTA